MPQLRQLSSLTVRVMPAYAPGRSAQQVHISAALLPGLAQLPRLRRLALGGGVLHPCVLAGVSLLRELDASQCMHLPGAPVSDYAGLADSRAHLTALSCSPPAAAWPAVFSVARPLSQLVALRVLGGRGAGAVQPAHLAALVACCGACLQDLDIDSPLAFGGSQAAWAPLAQLTALTSLDIRADGPALLGTLAQLSDLQALALTVVGAPGVVAREAWAPLQQLRQLTSITLQAAAPRLCITLPRTQVGGAQQPCAHACACDAQACARHAHARLAATQRAACIQGRRAAFAATLDAGGAAAPVCACACVVARAGPGTAA